MRNPILLAAIAATLASASPTLLADVTATVNRNANVRVISPLIYGANADLSTRSADRLGGNRWTAYNWENNASNAGRDFNYQNDGYLSASDTPAVPVVSRVQQNAAAGRATIVTVPVVDYVAADKLGNGDVRNSGPNYLQTRFRQNRPTGSWSGLLPNTSDGFVYQDQFVNFVESNRNGGQVLYTLDNEPDLWFDTHPEVHPQKVTYAEIVQRNVDYARAIKNVAPDAKVMGPGNYGWDGFRNLQAASDASGRDFQAFYLQQMKAASDASGRRLLDVLDMHWYPEAQGTNGVRITGSQTDAQTVAARLQAPRSLWDPTYVENSYITRDVLPAGDKAIRLLPRTQAIIDANYAGTQMSITEYNYGAGNHISGGLAQADVLGIYGQQGVYAANYWDLGNGAAYVDAAMRMYLNYDGQGGHFGDTSVGSVVSDNGSASLHAAVDSATGELTLVLINKSNAAQTMTLSLENFGAFLAGEAYQFDATSSVVNGVVTIDRLADVALAGNTFSFLMEGLSVTTIAFTPVPEPTTLAALTGLGTLALRRRVPTNP